MSLPGKCSIEGCLATFESSHGVVPQHGRTERDWYYCDNREKATRKRSSHCVTRDWLESPPRNETNATFGVKFAFIFHFLPTGPGSCERTLILFFLFPLHLRVFPAGSPPPPTANLVFVRMEFYYCGKEILWTVIGALNSFVYSIQTAFVPLQTPRLLFPGRRWTYVSLFTALVEYQSAGKYVPPRLAQLWNNRFQRHVTFFIPSP